MNHLTHSLVARLNALPMPVLVADRQFIITFANSASLLLLKKIDSNSVATWDGKGSSLSLFNTALPTILRRGSTSMECTLGKTRLHFSATFLENARAESDGVFIDWNIITDNFLKEETLWNFQ